jgi:hypothetical protein
MTSEKSKENSSSEVGSELKAIRVILAALMPLSDNARSSVISYVFRRLGIPLGQAVEAPYSTGPIRESVPVEAGHRGGLVDIRTLKEEKQPSSAREMAVLVAFYLSELAPPSERKTEISADDIRQYFKQAAFKLPAAPEMTLVHTRNAGYFDPGPARGLYKLNAVGYNLVAHSLPATPGASKPKRRAKSGGPAKKTKR